MKLWADFHPYVLPDVIGCPLPVVNHALREAAREFCLDSKAWIEADELTADGTTQTFDFSVDETMEFVQVMKATVGKDDLGIYSRRDLPADWREGGAKCNALYHGIEDCLIFPKPSSGAAIVIEIAVRPSTTGPGVGEDVFRFYVEAIAAGARYRLQKKPGTPWYSLTDAEIALGEFNKGVHTASNRGFMQKAPAQRRVKSWG